MNHIIIDGARHRVHRIERRGDAGRHGLVQVIVGTDRQPTGCHTLPETWVKDPGGYAVRTGGHLYSGGDR